MVAVGGPPAVRCRQLEAEARVRTRRLFVLKLAMAVRYQMCELMRRHQVHPPLPMVPLRRCHVGPIGRNEAPEKYVAPDSEDASVLSRWQCWVRAVFIVKEMANRLSFGTVRVMEDGVEFEL